MALTDEQYRKVMRKGWNMTVTPYERFWVPLLREYSIGCVERAELREGDRVLDVAAGPGVASLLAAERVGPRGSVLGADISDAFVEAATARALMAGRDNVRFQRHAMERLELSDASFDAAMCVLGLMYAAPLTSALAEMRRVLAPRGRFVACVWGERKKCGFRDVFSVLSEPLHMEVCPLFFSLGVPGAFADALTRAGFEDTREERTELVLSWPDDASACTAMFDGGPVAYPYSLFDADTKARVAAAYLKSLEPYRQGDGYKVPGEFVYAIARRRD